MVSLAAGAVVLVPFPFSDLSRSKLRPAVVLADAGRGDWILCQVTSNPYADPSAVMLAEDCFQEGTLSRVSYARPGKLFTASDELFVSRVGKLNQSVLKRLVGEVVQILNGDFAKE